MRTWLVVALLASCHGADRRPPADTDTGNDVTGCRAAPSSADRTRAVVISHPYDATGAQANAWEVLDLAADGTLTSPGRAFSMGRAIGGTVAFAPDGSLGIAVQDDGTLGVFTLDAERVPTVVDASFAGDPSEPFYASQVVFDATGERAWVVDGNWPNNGGGIYAITVDCATGAPSLEGKVISTKLASALYPLADGRAIVVAAEVDGAADGDTWLLSWGDAPAAIGAVALFDYPDAIPGGSTVTPDGKFAIVGDYSEFSGADNRLGVAAIGDGLTIAQEITPFLDPIAMVASPLGDGLLVLSGYGDAIEGFSYAPAADSPLTAGSHVDSQLPGAVDVVRTGPAAGIAVVTEVSGVRRVRFDGAGGLDDLGRLDLGGTMTAIPGAVGIQP